MKAIRLIVSLILLICGTNVVKAQWSGNYLYTDNVDWWGWAVESSIDSMLIEVKPTGLYAEIKVTFNFSTRGLEFEPEDSLEIQMMFDLPPKSEVTDMILWVFGQPEKAAIYDRWTANQIYEEIVDRRTDPAILYNYEWIDFVQGSIQQDLYRFNIFPVQDDLPRKAQITYQVPLKTESNGTFTCPLPKHIADLSLLPLEKFTLRVDPGLEFESFSVLEEPDLVWHPMGPFMETDLINSNSGSLTLELIPDRPDVYFGLQEDGIGGSDYFQFSIFPHNHFTFSETNKSVLVLFDYVISPTTGSASSSFVMEGFKNHFLPRLDDGDRVNILFSGVINEWYSDQWLTVNEAILTELSDSLNAGHLANYSDLQMLLFDAFQFLGQSGEEAEIVLITNSNLYQNPSQSEMLLQDYSASLQETPLHIIDLDNLDYSSEHINYAGQTFYGNEYLYQLIINEGGGEYRDINESTYAIQLDELATLISPSFEFLDIQFLRNGGFTHSHISLNDFENEFLINDTVILTGMAEGSGEFELIFSGIEENGTLHQLNMPLEVFSLDTVADNIYGGLLQRNLYSEVQSESLIEFIVENSEDHRVLSHYTAFLALEPDQGPLPVDNGGTAQTDITNEEKIELSVHPNPFGNTITIDSRSLTAQKVWISLIDPIGRQQTVLHEGSLRAGNTFNTFDTSALPSGLYLLVIQSSSGEILLSQKVIKS